MQILIVFLTGFFLGGIVEYSLTFLLEFLERKPLRINHRFTIGKKISLISLPIWGLLAVIFSQRLYPYLTLFLASAIVGTLLEGILGKFIKKMFGITIWTYKQGSIGNFTSLYAVPYWGAAGLVFGVLAKVFGI